MVKRERGDIEPPFRKYLETGWNTVSGILVVLEGYGAVSGQVNLFKDVRPYPPMSDAVSLARIFHERVQRRLSNIRDDDRRDYLRGCSLQFEAQKRTEPEAPVPPIRGTVLFTYSAPPEAGAPRRFEPKD